MSRHREEQKQRRVLGLLAGVSVSVLVLPGISMPGGFSFAALVIPFALFVIFNQLVSVWPENIRTAPPLRVLLLATIGLVQDFLIWLLVSWVADTMDLSLAIDGVLPMVWGAFIVRLTALACLALPSRAAVDEVESA
ncbi:hypothetical protein [Streptomyces sp. NBC_00690]|uniref:hypothetical protein n=1 Tax=Streptomyces sp. NBC_00690 TaxID=2975808 RepID=UPI002E2A6887|nr:hypothetical protein [Streptomyces sp. NBC_00690]